MFFMGVVDQLARHPSIDHAVHNWNGIITMAIVTSNISRRLDKQSARICPECVHVLLLGYSRTIPPKKPGVWKLHKTTRRNVIILTPGPLCQKHQFLRPRLRNTFAVGRTPHRLRSDGVGGALVGARCGLPTTPCVAAIKAPAIEFWRVNVAIQKNCPARSPPTSCNESCHSNRLANNTAATKPLTLTGWDRGA